MILKFLQLGMIKVRPGETDIDASSNVVVRLTLVVPRNKGYKVYFDNYFTSIVLPLFLYEQSILSLGTVRRNRLVNCELPNEK